MERGRRLNGMRLLRYGGIGEKKGEKDRKIDSEQVLTCEHTVSGNRREKEKEKKERRKG